MRTGGGWDGGGGRGRLHTNLQLRKRINKGYQVVQVTVVGLAAAAEHVAMVAACRAARLWSGRAGQWQQQQRWWSICRAEHQ